MLWGRRRRTLPPRRWILCRLRLPRGGERPEARARPPRHRRATRWWPSAAGRAQRLNPRVAHRLGIRLGIRRKENSPRVRIPQCLGVRMPQCLGVRMPQCLGVHHVHPGDGLRLFVLGPAFFFLTAAQLLAELLGHVGHARRRAAPNLPVARHRGRERLQWRWARARERGGAPGPGRGRALGRDALERRTPPPKSRLARKRCRWLGNSFGRRRRRSPWRWRRRRPWRRRRRRPWRWRRRRPWRLRWRRPWRRRGR